MTPHSSGLFYSTMTIIEFPQEVRLHPSFQAGTLLPMDLIIALIVLGKEDVVFILQILVFFKKTNFTLILVNACRNFSLKKILSGPVRRYRTCGLFGPFTGLLQPRIIRWEIRAYSLRSALSEMRRCFAFRAPYCYSNMVFAE